MDEFFSYEQEISKVVVQYVNLCQEREEVDIPVVELRASIGELYDMTNQFTAHCCSQTKDIMQLALDRLDMDVEAHNKTNIVMDLTNIFYVLRNYAQLIEYMSLLFQKNKEKEDLTVQRFLQKYENDEDPEKQQLAVYVKQHGTAELFNYEFADHYPASEIKVLFDESNKHYYTIYNGKKMYLSTNYHNEQEAADYIRTLYVEQDQKSPHCYQKEGFEVEEGDIVIDAGVAEGNFALDVIDKVSKIYLVECEDAWIKALKLTFEPYKDKVVFVNKFLDSFDDDSHITIDTLLDGSDVNYIKMDIEGAEISALAGAARTLKQNDHLKCNICSYHKMGDEGKIKEILSDNQFNVSTTQGYMFFKWNQDALLNLELRRGLTRGIK